MHYLSSKVLTPRLTHFREVEGGSLFPGDVTMTQAFQDSPLWGPKTNQVGHMLCALETGVRMGKLAQTGQHDKAFEHIVAISQAIEAPRSPAEVAQNLAKDKPRFAPPHQPRDGNSHQDIALSVYGFALGYQAMTQGLPSPQAAKTAFESLFSEKGTQAAAINGASQKHPSVLKP